MTILRIADRFGGTIDGAVRQLGYPELRPRELRRLTLQVVEAASAENLLRRWEEAQKAGKAVDMTVEEGRFFNELLRMAYACPGCGGLPGERHADGCPEDPVNQGER